MVMKGDERKRIDGPMRVVRLTAAVRLLIPALLLSTLPVGTRGASYEGGKFGLAVGALLTAGSLVVGLMLYPLAGLVGIVVLCWLLGTAGAVMLVNELMPMAFVKPICAKCRLLPIIKEHEAIHVAGVSSDDEVWASMKTRHSYESLGLDGDPSICSFCPIPRRLREH
jgi:hypothetical protein